MIKFDENTIAVWMIPMPPDKDYFCALMWTGNQFEAVGRLRIYNPESTDPFDGKDIKRWVRKQLGPLVTQSEALENVRNIIRQIAGLGGFQVEEVMAGSADDWFKILTAKNWIHMQGEAIPKGGN